MPRGDEDEIVARCAPLLDFGEALPGERLLAGRLVGLFAGLLASDRFFGELFFGELLAGAFLTKAFLAGRNFLE